MRAFSIALEVAGAGRLHVVDMEALACFVAVAEELHFAWAAERLHRSPFAVSRAVRDLERSLGTELFVRSPRSVRLT